MSHEQLGHTRLTTTGTWGSHHLPPYSILCGCPHGPQSNDFLFQDSQVGVPKLPRLGLSWIWGAITLHANFWLKLKFEQNCNPYQDLLNVMSHAICMHRNWVDSRLLVVGSQTTNLTLDPSFGYNLCFKCLNGQCEPILDIYVPRTFQWYKKRFKTLSFGPCNRLLKIRESTETPTPNVRVPLGVWGSIRSHFLALLGACGMTPELLSWPATFQPVALVASPRLGLRQHVWVGI
jgi:hypothetical protein